MNFPPKYSAKSSLLAWLRNYTKPYRRNLAILAALSFAEIGLRVLSPWPMQGIVDYALGGTPPPKWLAENSKERLLIAIAGTGLLIQLAHHVVMMLHTRLQSATGQHMVRDLRSQLFAHLQSLALSDHARLPQGDSVYRLESDAPAIENLIFNGVYSLGFSVITLLVMFGVLLSMNSQLALVSMIIVPPMYAWLRFYTKRVAPRVDETKRLESKLAGRLYESFSAIRLIKSFARETFEQTRFRGAADQAMDANIQLGRHESVFAVVIAGLTVLGNAVVLVLGGLDVIAGTLTIGSLLVVVAYLSFVYGPLSAIAYTTGNLQRALASARRVRETLSMEPEDIQSDAVEIKDMAGRVTFENVFYHYDEGRPVLKDISFQANPGETIALVGPSGAGKSTLVSLVARFYEVQSGRILIDGVDIRSYSLQSLRERVAVVLQDAVLMSGSINENVRYGRLDATDEEIQAASRAANAHNFIQQLPKKYDTDLGASGLGLSGGQKQRISIARAFVKDAPILILDEPTAALDTISEVLVLDALKRLRGGRTTFVIAHRLSTIREADRILVMEEGRIVAAGTDEQLLKTSPLYRKLCQQLHETEAEGILETVELVDPR